MADLLMILSNSVGGGDSRPTSQSSEPNWTEFTDDTDVSSTQPVRDFGPFRNEGSTKASWVENRGQILHFSPL